MKACFMGLGYIGLPTAIIAAKHGVSDWGGYSCCYSFFKSGRFIESTSPVGTTEMMTKLIFDERPELEGNIYIAYCPERVLPGNVIYELVHNDRIIGGINPESTEKAIAFYS